MTTDVPGQGDLLELYLNSENYFVLVISPRQYNEKTGRILVCLLTANPADYPFEVEIQLIQSTQYDENHFRILADRVDNVDWRTIDYAYRGCVTKTVMAEVTAKLGALLKYA